MSKLVKTLFSCFSAGFALAVAGILILGLSSQQLNKPLGQETTVKVPSGASIHTVGKALQAKGLTNSPRFFAAAARLKGVAHQIKAGDYQVNPDTSLNQLLGNVVAGKVQLHRLVLVEGWSFKEFRLAINRHPQLLHDSQSLSDEQIMAKLGKAGQHPEGRFFPDTYSFPSATSDFTIYQLAARALEKTLAEEWAKQAPGLPYATPYEALIMASIVEKETGIPEERPEIAGVFVRRINKKMRLQTDPTVIYGMGDRYKGNIRRKHLREATPYNTYVIPGLPPTPIAMVGREAIHAALNPKDGNSLYFVATGSEGRHYFSSTLAEHNKAVYKYQIAPHKKKR